MKRYFFRSSKPSVILLSFVLFVPFPIFASSLTLEETATNLNPFIQSVSMCGEWHHKNEKGRFRVIYGWLWGHTEIYVQWIADPIWYPEKGQEERPEPLVVKTLSFPDLNDYESATDLINVKCEKQNGQWAITADAHNGHEEGEAAKYRLTIYLYDIPGKYKLIEVYPSKPDRVGMNLCPRKILANTWAHETCPPYV